MLDLMPEQRAWLTNLRVKGACQQLAEAADAALAALDAARQEVSRLTADRDLWKAKSGVTFQEVIAATREAQALTAERDVLRAALVQAKEMGHELLAAKKHTNHGAAVAGAATMFLSIINAALEDET